jgi:hypothetical protein
MTRPRHDPAAADAALHFSPGPPHSLCGPGDAPAPSARPAPGAGGGADHLAAAPAPGASFSCGGCRFWRLVEAGAGSGDCRRHAPAADPATGEALWPRVFIDEYCGDFESGGPAVPSMDSQA